jgi:hypothetical protein
MAYIYALQGKYDTGKTQTIKKLYALLVNKYKISKAQINELPTDCWDIKIIISGVKREKIGIESHGDTEKRLKQSIKDFVKNGCSLIFCTCRSRGNTVNYLKRFSSQHKIYFIEQPIISSPSQQKQNYINTANLLIKKAGL